jgi:hypothetical protein
MFMPMPANAIAVALPMPEPYRVRSSSCWSGNLMKTLACFLCKIKAVQKLPESDALLDFWAMATQVQQETNVEANITSISENC